MKLDQKKYPSLAAVLYPLGELVLSLIGSKKVFDAELKAKVEAKDIKVEIDGEKIAIPAKVKTYEVATLPVEEDADREWVVSLIVPYGQEDKYLKGLKSVFKGFKVERLPYYRKPKAIPEKVKADAAEAAKPAKGKTIQHTEEHAEVCKALREAQLPMGDVKDRKFKDKALADAVKLIDSAFWDLDAVRESLAKDHGIVEDETSVFYDDAVKAGWKIKF